MTRIVLDLAQLGETASALANTAGDYQLVGARVASCDSGCMPRDIASVVEPAGALNNFRGPSR